MLGTLGDAKTDTLAAQAGANTAVLLLQMEQYLAQEPLLTKDEAVLARLDMIAKLQTERDWSFKYAPKAKEYLNLDEAIAYLKTLYYPQDLYGSPINEKDISIGLPTLSKDIDDLEILYNKRVEEQGTLDIIYKYFKQKAKLENLNTQLSLLHPFNVKVTQAIVEAYYNQPYSSKKSLVTIPNSNPKLKSTKYTLSGNDRQRLDIIKDITKISNQIKLLLYTEYDLLEKKTVIRNLDDQLYIKLTGIEDSIKFNYSETTYNIVSEHIIVRFESLRYDISLILQKGVDKDLDTVLYNTYTSLSKDAKGDWYNAILAEGESLHLLGKKLGLEQEVLDLADYVGNDVSKDIQKAKDLLALYPGTRVEFNISKFAYGVNHPIFTGAVKDGVTGKLYGDDNLISATLGANTASILLMLNQYESVEGMLPYNLQAQNRQEIEKVILDEIEWQKIGVMAPDSGFMLSWHKPEGRYLAFGYSGNYINHYINEYGREAFTTVNKPYVHPIRLAESKKLQDALNRLKSLPYPVYGENTPIGDTVKEQIKQQADLFTLSKIVPLTKQDFDKILSSMSDSDWAVMGLTRLFTHEEYVEMMALAWSDPVYAQEWLDATQTELDRIGYRPTGCKDFKAIMTSGNYSDISYKAAVYECLHPIIFYPQYIYHPAGFMGSTFGKILMMVAVVAVAYFAAPMVAALTTEMGLVAGATTGLSTIAVATINGVIAGAVTSTITQAAFTGDVNILNVGIAALGAGIAAGIGNALSSPTTISPLEAGISPPIDSSVISVDSGGSFVDTSVPIDVPISNIPISNFPVETFDIVSTDVPWYQTTVDLPIVGDVNPTAVVTSKVVSSGLDALKQEVNTGQVDPTVIGVSILASGATAIVVGAGSTIYNNVVNTISNIIGTESSVDVSVTNVPIETPVVDTSDTSNTILSSDLSVFQPNPIVLDTGINTDLYSSISTITEPIPVTNTILDSVVVDNQLISNVTGINVEPVVVTSVEPENIPESDSVPSFDMVPLGELQPQETFDTIQTENDAYTIQTENDAYTIPTEENSYIIPEPENISEPDNSTISIENINVPGNINPTNPINPLINTISVGVVNTGFRGLFTQLFTDVPDKLIRSPITNARAPIGYHYNSSGNIVSSITGQVTPIQDTTVQTQSEIGIPWGLVFSFFTAKENKWI